MMLGACEAIKHSSHLMNGHSVHVGRMKLYTTNQHTWLFVWKECYLLVGEAIDGSLDSWIGFSEKRGAGWVCKWRWSNWVKLWSGYVEGWDGEEIRRLALSYGFVFSIIFPDLWIGLLRLVAQLLCLVIGFQFPLLPVAHLLARMGPS